jgi:hypothetical protein
MLTTLITTPIEDLLRDVAAKKELDLYSNKLVDRDTIPDGFAPCYEVKLYSTKEFYAVAKSSNAMAIRHQTILGGSFANDGSPFKKHQLQLISSGADANQTICNRDFAIMAIEEALTNHTLCFFNCVWCDYFKSMLSAASYDEQNSCWTASAILLIGLSEK